MDLALQCAPDHPWATSHPEWFTTRLDGSIAYAENPPKKYQDIYPVNFDNDPEGIYQEVLRIVRLWMSHGIRTFRVDNPHTKPVAFWERLIGQVVAEQPDAIFLAEAFTRPAMMNTLGGWASSSRTRTSPGATPSGSWRSTSASCPARPPRGSARTSSSTPRTSSPSSCSTAGRRRSGCAPRWPPPLSPSWGVYSGYELYEHVARPGAEEYLDNEKFQYRPRDWAAYEEGGAKAGQSLAPYLRAAQRDPAPAPGAAPPAQPDVPHLGRP